MDQALTNRERRDLAIAEREEVVSHLPTELTLAATDRCNLRCVTCGTHHRQEGPNNAGLYDFPASDVEKLLGMTEGAERIQVHGGGGEPLMSRSFWEWVTLFSKNPEANIEFNTNGLLFTEKAINRLLDHRVSVISISCDAATPDTYKKIRGADFNKLLRNVKALVAERDRRGNNDLTVNFNMTVTKSNVHDAPLLVQLAHDLRLSGVELYQLNPGENYNWTETKPDLDFVFDYRDNLPERHIAYVKPFLDEAQSLAAKLGVNLFMDPRLQYLGAKQETAAVGAPAFVEYSECTTAWRWLNVGVNGDVYPCCMATSPVGNLKDVANLSDIWNGKTMQRLRRNIGRNTIDPICKGGSCAYVMKDTFKDVIEMQLQRENEELKKELADVRAAHSAEKRRADEFEQSKSWKITAPLRKLVSLFQGRTNLP